MKSLSIKTKVIGVLAACLAVAAVALIGLENSAYRKNVEAIGERTVAGAQTTYRNIEASETSKLGCALTSLMNDERMLELYLKRDREGLLAYATPLYQDLKSRYAVTNWHFMDVEPQMWIFLRLHDPGKYDEVFWHQTAVNAINTQDYATGMELGKFGFALRVVSPYRDKTKKVVGYMEVAEDISRFAANMKAETGDEYSLVAKKELLDRAKYATSMERKKIRNNWDDQKNVVALGATSEDQSLAVYDEDLASLPETGRFLGCQNEGGRVYVRGVFPLKDVTNKTLGGVFVRHDITALYQDMKSAQTAAIVAIVCLMVILSTVLTIVLRQLVFARLEKTMAVATRVAGGDFESRIEPTSDDEVGRLEGLLEGFRNLFVNTVRDYEQQLEEARKKAA